ncbi:WSC domain-containing protein [Xylaria intraflava]|nr:WSC domain-containing protein [Xylaria intraflava]
MTSVLPSLSSPTPLSPPPSTTAQSAFINNAISPLAPSTSKPALEIGESSDGAYTYAGCWNETTDLPGTTGLRALDGINKVLLGTMTVQKCLDFCAHSDGAHGAHRLAGLEYSRECWCADKLNSLSVRLTDDSCDMPCDGANTTACGGALRLSLYNVTGAGAGAVSAAVAITSWNWQGEGAWGVLAVGLMGFAWGFALRFL